MQATETGETKTFSSEVFALAYQPDKAAVDRKKPSRNIL